MSPQTGPFRGPDSRGEEKRLLAPERSLDMVDAPEHLPRIPAADDPSAPPRPGPKRQQCQQHGHATGHGGLGREVSKSRGRGHRRETITTCRAWSPAPGTAPTYTGAWGVWHSLDLGYQRMSRCPICGNAEARLAGARRLPGAGTVPWLVSCPSCPVPFEIAGQDMNLASTNPRELERRRPRWRQLLEEAAQRGEKRARLY